MTCLSCGRERLLFCGQCDQCAPENLNFKVAEILAILPDSEAVIATMQRDGELWNKIEQARAQIADLVRSFSAI